jgi:transcriptional regulator GlxA family with amidase domain
VLETSARERYGPDAILAAASAVVEPALRRRLATDARPVDRHVRVAAARLSAGTSVRAVAAEVGLSERQLARRFAERVGVPPKAFARVLRFQRAAALLASGHAPSATALACGYADQAHLTREGAALAGITPAALARELSDSFNTPLAIAF